MEDDIFEDLEKLFEECDNVSRTFYKSDIKDNTFADAPNSVDDQNKTRIYAEGEKPADEDVSERSPNCCMKSLHTDHQKTNNSQSELESSKEEGECTRTFEDSKDCPVVVCSKPSTVLKQKIGNQRCVKNVGNYSSFIESSKEDGECSTTSFEEDELETTIKAASPEKASQKCSENDKENNKSVKISFTKKGVQRDLKTGRKRKRSLSEKNESTPKRRHLFLTEELLSPISCCSADKRKNVIEVEETPVIQCKFSHQEDNICSSTPLTNEQKYIIPTSTQCSTPIATSHSKKHKHVVKKEILKTEVSSDSESEFIALSDTESTNEKEQTVEEIIAEITQLCENSNENIKVETENVNNNFDKNLSKIEINDLISEWKTRSKCECSFDSSNSDNDKTLTEKVQDDNQSEAADHTHSDLGNLTVVAAEDVLKKKETGKSMNETKDRDGRFKAEVTICRVEGEDGSETNREIVDMDICDHDEGEIQYADDLLKLNDYDDEGFVDENILEKSHLTKKKEITVKNKGDKNEKVEEDSSKGTREEKQMKTVEHDNSLFNLVQSLKKQTEKDNKVDANKNIVKGLDYAAFDTAIFRKKDNTAIEKEVCRRWGTQGSADPDLNLTVATTKRNRCRKMGQEPKAGILEGEKVVCTHLYEDEVMATFKRYGKAHGQSDMFYLSLENLIAKLYHQKEILDSRNKQTLINLRQDIILRLEQTKVRHSQELTALKLRQGMEDKYFRFNTRNQYNIMTLQNNLMQLRQEHVFQEQELRQHQHEEYQTLRFQGMAILDMEVERHNLQCEPIDELIAQLEKPESHSMTSPQKYGPPIVVSLRKGPCRASGGKHSTVAVCLSAGIAQAVSLEDDLYDHYYSY